MGAQIPVSAGSFVDLSSARAVTVRLRGLSISPTAAAMVYIQVGSVSEDLDGTGVLKAEASPTDPGFPSSIRRTAVTLKVVPGPSSRETAGSTRRTRMETWSSTWKTPTASSRTAGATISGTPSTLDNSWKNFTFTLSDADRQKLLQARSVRIIIEAPPGRRQGKILVDSVTVEATPFWPQVGAGDSKSNVGVQEVAENLAQLGPVNGDLASRFPETYNRFHPDGEQNQVLETVWTARPHAATFTVQGFIPQGTSDRPEGTGGIQYETVVSYIRADQPAPHTRSPSWTALRRASSGALRSRDNMLARGEGFKEEQQQSR